MEATATDSRVKRLDDRRHTCRVNRDWCRERGGLALRMGDVAGWRSWSAAAAEYADEIGWIDRELTALGQ